MSNTSAPTSLDRTRLWWASSRYDFWLDTYCVPRRERRDLRSEFESNVADAAAHVGSTAALARIGSLRRLAAETSSDGQLRSRWIAGWVTALSVLAISAVTFLVLTLYYAEGVLDSEATRPVTSSLFPFLGSSITVDGSAGLEFSMQPGPLPLILAATTWLLVAAPWRTLGNRRATR